MSHTQLYDNAKQGMPNGGLKRNAFDVSSRHFASYTLGKIYPFYTRMLQPNETLTLRPSMNFELDPFAHQIKNRLVAHVEYFKVPLRILWKDWKAFYMSDPIKDNSGLVPPYLSRPDGVVKVGSLLNHMGVPAVSHSRSNHYVSVPMWRKCDDEAFVNSVPIRFSTYCNTIYRDWSNPTNVTTASNEYGGFGCIRPVYRPTSFSTLGEVVLNGRALQQASSQLIASQKLLWPFTTPIPCDLKYSSTNATITFYRKASAAATDQTIDIFFFVGESWYNAVLSFSKNTSLKSLGNTTVENVTIADGKEHPLTSVTSTYSGIYLTEEECQAINDLRKQGNVYIAFGRSTTASSGGTRPNLHQHCSCSLYGNVGESKAYDITPGPCGEYQVYTDQEITSADTSIFNGTNVDLRLSAFYPRAYRACYNAIKRNKIFDPFCPAVNPHDSSTSTIPYVDRCVENLDGGADTDTPLDFEYVEYAEDYYNGCLPSPTMVTERPLIGVTKSEDAFSADLHYHSETSTSTEDGTISLAIDAEQNNKITGITAHEGFDANHVTIQSLQDAIKIGISLDDLRNVKALTKWYEDNYKFGRFSYRQFCGAHFSQFPDGVEENFPTRLGGCNIKLSEWEVINSSTSDDGEPLGKRGAMGQFSGNLKKIVCKSNGEPCIVLGWVYFTIDNNMVDSLNRTWFISKRSDFPSPDFKDCGCDAVRLREVAPLLAGSNNAMQIFGYNRTYGFMVESHDTIAGEYCNSRDGEIAVRRLSEVPTLDMEFRTIDPDSFASIFTSKNSADHIFGHFFTDAKLTTWLKQRPANNIM